VDVTAVLGGLAAVVAVIGFLVANRKRIGSFIHAWRDMASLYDDQRTKTVRSLRDRIGDLEEAARSLRAAARECEKRAQRIVEENDYLRDKHRRSLEAQLDTFQLAQINRDAVHQWAGATQVAVALASDISVRHGGPPIEVSDVLRRMNAPLVDDLERSRLITVVNNWQRELAADLKELDERPRVPESNSDRISALETGAEESAGAIVELEQRANDAGDALRRR
jgi:hypothetical protein